MADNGLQRGAQGLQVCVMAEIPANVVLADAFAEAGARVVEVAAYETRDVGTYADAILHPDFQFILQDGAVAEDVGQRRGLQVVGVEALREAGYHSVFSGQKTYNGEWARMGTPRPSPSAPAGRLCPGLSCRASSRGGPSGLELS